MINGVYATFMPKPLFGINGSGMHTHQSLFKGKQECLLSIAKDQYHLSANGKSYIAGLLKHAREITAVSAASGSTPTSAWCPATKPRSISPGPGATVPPWCGCPCTNPAKKPPPGCEYRAPDPACNPYLAFAVMLAAGLKGIEDNYKLPEPVEEDIYQMTEAERQKMGIEELPGSLDEAVVEVEKSEVVKEALGDHVFNKFIENKKIEWDNYRIHVSDYEIDRYLPIL